MGRKVPGPRTLAQESEGYEKAFCQPLFKQQQAGFILTDRTSNDYDFTHLVQHHRVVVYGYEERALYDGEYVSRADQYEIKHVRLIHLYDPNHMKMMMCIVILHKLR